MPTEDRLLVTEEVAELLRVPTGTLYNWRLNGKGPRAVRQGKRLVWRESDVRRYIDEMFATHSKAGAA